MLKLLLSAALIGPALILPVMALSDQTVPTLDTKFESVYIDPELKKIDLCNDASLDIYFYEDMITLHSAEYLSEGVTQLHACESSAVEIQPVLNINPTDTDRELLDARISELTLVLDAHDISVDILPVSISKEANALSMNGRAAIVKFSPADDSPSS